MWIQIQALASAGASVTARGVAAFRLSTTTIGSTKAPSTLSPVRRSIRTSSEDDDPHGDRDRVGQAPQRRGAQLDRPRDERDGVRSPAGQGREHGQAVDEVLALDEVGEGEPRRNDVTDDRGVDQVSVHDFGNFNTGGILPYPSFLIGNQDLGLKLRRSPASNTGRAPASGRAPVPWDRPACDPETPAPRRASRRLCPPADLHRAADDVAHHVVQEPIGRDQQRPAVRAGRARGSPARGTAESPRRPGAAQKALKSWRRAATPAPCAWREIERRPARARHSAAGAARRPGRCRSDTRNACRTPSGARRTRPAPPGRPPRGSRGASAR